VRGGHLPYSITAPARAKIEIKDLEGQVLYTVAVEEES
jgi:hypothetical protein